MTVLNNATAHTIVQTSIHENSYLGILELVNNELEFLVQESRVLLHLPQFPQKAVQRHLVTHMTSYKSFIISQQSQLLISDGIHTIFNKVSEEGVVSPVLVIKLI